MTVGRMRVAGVVSSVCMALTAGYREHLEPSGGPECVDGIYPHLAMQNGDANVVCREVATERDLLYAGGVFYELPAENAGGFAALRPIALADEPVRTLAVDRGLIVVNGRRMAPDRLWRNGTAGTAYALWRRHFRPQKKPTGRHAADR